MSYLESREDFSWLYKTWWAYIIDANCIKYTVSDHPFNDDCVIDNVTQAETLSFDWVKQNLIHEIQTQTWWSCYENVLEEITQAQSIQQIVDAMVKGEF